MTDQEIIQVGPVDPTKETSPILTVEPADGAEGRATCIFAGKPYSTGARVCSAGRMLRCYANGNWVDLGKC